MPDPLPDPDEEGLTVAERTRRLLYRRHAEVQASHGHEAIPYDRYHGGYHDGMRDYPDEVRMARWGLSPMSARDPRERRQPGRKFIGRRNSA